MQKENPTWANRERYVPFTFMHTNHTRKNHISQELYDFEPRSYLRGMKLLFWSQKNRQREIEYGRERLQWEETLIEKADGRRRCNKCFVHVYHQRSPLFLKIKNKNNEKNQVLKTETRSAHAKMTCQYMWGLSANNHKTKMKDTLCGLRVNWLLASPHRLKPKKSSSSSVEDSSYKLLLLVTLLDSSWRSSISDAPILMLRCLTRSQRRSLSSLLR